MENEFKRIIKVTEPAACNGSIIYEESICNNKKTNRSHIFHFDKAFRNQIFYALYMLFLVYPIFMLPFLLP